MNGLMGYMDEQDTQDFHPIHPVHPCKFAAYPSINRTSSFNLLKS